MLKNASYARNILPAHLMLGIMMSPVPKNAKCVRKVAVKPM